MAHRRVHFRGGVGGARGRSGRVAGPSEGAPRRMALYFSGRERAGENLAKVLKQRAAEMSPAIQMSDALSRNVPVREGFLLTDDELGWYAKVSR